jgi:hypothetical protein
VGEVVINASAVGQLVTFVAPGFLARVGYRARFPGPDRPAGEVLIIAVVISLPLVALINAALPGAQKPSQLGYVSLLMAVAFIGGYLSAVLRGRQNVKSVMAKLGYRLEPPGSIYSHTLRELSDDAYVIVELKDGRRISGMPRNGPQHKDDGINELYLTYPEAEGGADEWLPVGEGLIVPLGEVSSIALAEEPTGAAGEERHPAKRRRELLAVTANRDHHEHGAPSTTLDVPPLPQQHRTGR